MTYYNFIIQQKMWYKESFLEKGLKEENINEDFSIYPERIYKNINLTNNKIYDYCFIGSLKIDDLCFQNRKWIIPFIEKYFNENSYLQFTDKETKKNYNSFGSFDYTLFKKGKVPKELQEDERDFFDKDYFDILSKSKFCLCPAGDSIWSMRFCDTLMSKCIPIVNSKHETYRSLQESKLDYKYYLTSEKEFIYRQDWVDHNYNLFLKYHTLEFNL
jgi:hypothetical protein